MGTETKSENVAETRWGHKCVPVQSGHGCAGWVCQNAIGRPSVIALHLIFISCEINLLQRVAILVLLLSFSLKITAFAFATSLWTTQKITLLPPPPCETGCAVWVDRWCRMEMM